MLGMYETCQQIQAHTRAHAAAASGLLGHTEFRLRMPPSIAFATRGLRLQLALLDRDFDDLDYDTLIALDSDNTFTSHSTSEEEIHSLPVLVHKYKFHTIFIDPCLGQGTCPVCKFRMAGRRESESDGSYMDRHFH